MTAPMQLINPGDHLQRMRRAGRHYTDQHGRKFFAMADATSQQPVEELRPAGWKAEWIPPMRFARFSHDGDLTFRWDYQTMADELSEATASYYEQATKFAMEHNLPVPDVGGVVDRRIASVFGQAPLSPEIPLAADAGDRWLLGYPDAPQVDDLAVIIRQGTISTGNDALRAIRERIASRASGITPPAVPVDDAPAAAEAVTYQQFIAEGRKGGMSMADLSLAWAAHKQNLAEAAV